MKRRQVQLLAFLIFQSGWPKNGIDLSNKFDPHSLWRACQGPQSGSWEQSSLSLENRYPLLLGPDPGEDKSVISTNSCKARDSLETKKTPKIRDFERRIHITYSHPKSYLNIWRELSLDSLPQVKYPKKLPLMGTWICNFSPIFSSLGFSFLCIKNFQVLSNFWFAIYISFSSL